MAATVCAARSPLEMIVGGKDHVATIIKVGVRIHQCHSMCLRKNGLGIIQFTRDSGDGLQTRSAKASGLDTIGGESAQNMVRHEDLLAPAGSLVEVAFRHATLIVTTAPGTLLVITQA